jgi:lon-related putative ATP-dependent protease
MSPHQPKAAPRKTCDGLPPSALRRPCKPKSLLFKTTDELPDLQDVIGQPRAIRALELGSEVTGPGYNIFVMGLSGSGRTTLSQEYLQRKAAAEPVPDDWCYVNNFADPHQPKVLRLPAGRGTEFRKDLRELIERCQGDVPRAFESDEFTRERDYLVNELKKAHEAEFVHLQIFVEKYSFVIARTPFGFVLAPAVEGKPLTPEELEKLSEEQRVKLRDLQFLLTEEVEKSLGRMRDLEKTAFTKIQELTRRTVWFVIGAQMETLKARYVGLDTALAYLEAVQNDIMANAGQFHPHEGEAAGSASAALSDRDWSRRYEVNLLVDNATQKGAPVVLENYPSYNNLLGRIEHEAIMGATRTDFTMIRPGALHRANGGYLLLPARDVLLNMYAWESLKRVLRDGEIRIVELANQLGLLSTATLEPEPIPLKVKAILVGTPLLYYLLRQHDEDFAKLFKVRAEFATLMERNPETEHEYGLFVKSVVDDNHLPPFDRTAVARVIEYSSRLADDQAKLTTRFGKIADLLREAAYWAGKTKKKVVNRAAVQKAIDETVYRSNLIEARLQELIADGTLMIDVSGGVVGQVNALSVYLLGDYEFGRPSRVTAVAYPGKGGVVDIERQAKLGGAIHTKGVLILSGLIGSRYGRGQPLSLSASLTFEQSYDAVEGDSASAAELLALLSAIAEIPLRQDRAITGSINQQAHIQPIGGVNEKIEGFFAVCKTKGLTGEQGVLIPASNQRHLMLTDEVVQAVAGGLFHVWAVTTIDEAIPLLTNTPAGNRQADGSYAEGTFNHTVAKRLGEFNKILQATGAKDDGRKANENSG